MNVARPFAPTMKEHFIGQTCGRKVTKVTCSNGPNPWARYIWADGLSYINRQPCFCLVISFLLLSIPFFLLSFRAGRRGMSGLPVARRTMIPRFARDDT